MRLSGFEVFDRMSGLAAGTRTVLYASLTAEERPESARIFLTGQALPHLRLIDEGVALSTPAAGLSEAANAYLVARLSPLWEFGAESPTDIWRRRWAEVREYGFRLHRPGTDALVALDHARVVFAAIPVLPEGLASWPSWRVSYRDVRPPSGPVELIDRVGEMTRTLWRVAGGSALREHDQEARRTFAFFETAVWLRQAGMGRDRDDLPE